MMKIQILGMAILGLLFLPSNSDAHGGRLNGSGCHNDRQAGTYHCHQGPLAGRSFSSQAQAQRALEATQPTQAQESPARCHPSYEDACLDPAASDYDCRGGSGNGPLYTGRVRVVGPDVFGLDRDGDGVGCE